MEEFALGPVDWEIVSGEGDGELWSTGVRSAPEGMEGT